jgi:ATP-binding cassette subfamily B multidrug efflux pump
MKHIVKLRSFLKPYWKQSLLAVIVLSAVVFMDLLIPRLIQRIIDQGIGNKDMQLVIHTTLWMLGISVANTLLATWNNNLSVWVDESFTRDLREALFVKVQSLSFGNLDRLRTGNLIVRLTSDLAAVQRVIRLSLRIGTRAPLLLIGSLLLMVNTNKQLATDLLPLLVVTAALITFFTLRLGPMFLSIQQKLDGLNNVLQENIAGVRVVKAFVRAQHENKRFRKVNQDFAEFSIKAMQFISSFFPLLTLLTSIGTVVVIWVGGIDTIRNGFTVGEIVAFTNYLMTTMFPLMIMGMLSTQLAWGNASAERINQVLESEPEIVEPAQPVSLPQPVKGRVEFKDVCFHYNGSSDELILQDINLTAEPGEMVAILGATGAGKTSLVNLIPRFYDVTEGSLLIDGIDVRQLHQDDLFAHIGMAMQESVLFSGTVEDNIRYGDPSASDEQVIEAAKAAQAHDFIMEMPQGYDTHIEARGVNLSGGQKQRISIARALLVRPKILILDDSTSSVDVETEGKIQDALERLMENTTSFVVAQRISTVLNADKIVVLDKGKIAALGNHAELIKTSEIYQEIYDSQLGGGFSLNNVMMEKSMEK